MNADDARTKWTPRGRWLVRMVIGCLLLAATGPAVADVRVLSFQGTDAAKVQAAITTALNSSGHQATAGDTSYEDAAVLIGCDPSSDACGEQVLSTLDVDEVVFGTSAKNGELVLHRVARGQPHQQTKAHVEPGKSLEAALAPALRELFGEAPPDDRAAPPADAQSKAQLEPVESTTSAPALDLTRPPQREHRYLRWSIVAWGGSGAAVVTGLLFWIRAGSLQDDLDKTNNAGTVQDLESRRSTAIAVGNTLMIASVGLAGLGTYFWVKDRRARHAPSTAIGPMLLPGGGGVLVTLAR